MITTNYERSASGQNIIKKAFQGPDPDLGPVKPSPEKIKDTFEKISSAQDVSPDEKTLATLGLKFMGAAKNPNGVNDLSGLVINSMAVLQGPMAGIIADITLKAITLTGTDLYITPTADQTVLLKEGFNAVVKSAHTTPAEKQIAQEGLKVVSSSFADARKKMEHLDNLPA